MDKRLIDADKLLEWLENSEEADKFWTTTVPPIEKHDLIKDAINEGKFDPDPIPLPTIKPGDTRDAEKMLDGVLREIDKLKLYDSNPKAFKRISDIINEEVSHE